MPLDFNEVEAGGIDIYDATEWKFLVNAMYEGGVTVRIKKPEDVDAAIPIIRKALNLA